MYFCYWFLIIGIMWTKITRENCWAYNLNWWKQFEMKNCILSKLGSQIVSKVAPSYDPQTLAFLCYSQYGSSATEVKKQRRATCNPVYYNSLHGNTVAPMRLKHLHVVYSLSVDKYENINTEINWFVSFIFR